MTEDAAEYCRQIEAYLCGKNDGHLVRIVGPAFERVCVWAQQGVPLKIAFRGIDQYCERYYAKGPRRRPVRIEFCEADILDLFDAWRRAIGVTSAGETTEAPPRRTGLAAHIERVIVRLTALRAGDRPAPFCEQVDSAVRTLDTLLADARHARGEARAAIVDRLAATDRELIRAAVHALDARAASELRAEAVRELAVFGARLPADARTRAVEAAFERLVRESTGLPTLRFD